MSNEAFLFKPEKGEEIIVNDGSSFSAPLFSEANIVFGALKSLPFSDALIVPDGYYEDGFQLGEKRNFFLGDWLIVALAVDYNFKLSRALVIHRHRQEEGFVFDFASSKVTVSFYRYFEIKETSSSQKVSEFDFLESIHVSIDEPETYRNQEIIDDVEDDDEYYFDDSELYDLRPAFTPAKKNYIPSIGGGSNKQIEEPDEEDEDIEFEITKPTFVAGGNKKPLNLNDRRPKKTQYRNVPPKVESSGDEDSGEEVHFEVTKPTFTSYSKKKPGRIIDERKQKSNKPKPAKSEIVNETPAEPSKPAFTPSSKGKPQRIRDEVKIEKVAVPPLESPATPEIEKTEPKEPNVYKDRVEPAVISDATVNYRFKESYNLRPETRFKEGCLLNDPFNKYAHDRCVIIYEKLKELKSLRISPNCLFVPSLLDNDDPHFLLAKEFDAEQWTLLAFVYDETEKPIYALLSNKEEENLAFLISFRHKDPRVVVFSLSGIRLNDPAYPLYTYENLLAIAKGEASFGLR